MTYGRLEEGGHGNFHNAFCDQCLTYVMPKSKHIPSIKWVGVTLFVKRGTNTS